MRYLLLGVVLVSFASASIAEGTREKNLRQYVGDSSKAARIARLGGAFSSPCSCSAGTPLQGIGAVVFNCSCGTMQCVVAASGTGSDTPNVVCH